MTIATFRRIALSMPEAEESAHMGHPDFRVGGKIFATLGAPDKHFGMVRLTPEHQNTVVHAEPGIFSTGPGAWGRQGATYVRLAPATEAILRPVMIDAWRARAAKTLLKRAGVPPA